MDQYDKQIDKNYKYINKSHINLWRCIKGKKKLETSSSLIVLLLFIHITLSTLFLVVNGEKVCNSMDIVNADYKQLNDLRDCHIINGSLSISLLSIKNITKYELSIKEITGYLLIYRIDNIYTLNTLLPNLTIIRGFELFANRYSLIIYENKNLYELGLRNLLKINKGSIRIANNPLLCYVNTINWIEIFENNIDQEYILKRNKDHCPICKDNKFLNKELYFENFCWNYEYNQRRIDRDEDCLLFDSTIIRGRKPCLLCKNLKDQNGFCVDECPPNYFELNGVGCISERKCDDQNFAIHNEKCIEKCPNNYIKVSRRCIDCENIPGKCDRPCSVNLLVIRSEDDAKILSKCNIVNGSIIIELRFTKSKINLEQYMSDITEITGFLKISRSPQIETLHFFRSLQTIAGKDVYQNRYSLYISENEKLERLWRHNQNVIFLNGTGYFHMNQKLCLNKSNYNFLNEKDRLSIVTPPNSNGAKAVCDDNFYTMDARIEDVNATAVRIKLEPWTSYERRCLIGYYFYYIEAPEKNITDYGGFHCCGNNNWKMDITLTINVRHVIRGLKPNTQYAFFVRSFTIVEYHIKKDGVSNIQYFTTDYLKPEPVNKFFYNIINNSSVEFLWRPPLNKNSNISFYKINCTRIHNYMENITRPLDKQSIDIEQCPRYEWINESPGSIKNITDFYTEYLQFDDNVPNMLYFKKPDNDPDNDHIPKHHSTTTTTTTTTMSTTISSIPSVTTDEWDFWSARDMENIKMQDNGTDNFPIIHPELIGEQIFDNSQNIYEIKGHRTNYTVNHLFADSMYYISIKACAEMNSTTLCSPESYVEVNTPIE